LTQPILPVTMVMFLCPEGDNKFNNLQNLKSAENYSTDRYPNSNSVIICKLMKFRWNSSPSFDTLTNVRSCTIDRMYRRIIDREQNDSIWECVTTAPVALQYWSSCVVFVCSTLGCRNMKTMKYVYFTWPLPETEVCYCWTYSSRFVTQFVDLLSPLIFVMLLILLQFINVSLLWIVEYRIIEL